ncbi:ABC transporter permease [Desulfovibrio sulfodismutans]|uniref:ABC transporter permease n=1 Tax=Desulfolutivibrio sulfodismutans TaxID=63561 RepID=A0A7K3NMC2_9BACT|nr:FtsX-like permease family protein [Desulfolutivibrio sulfodismutans]NDY56925.1 ABC transporter permease [Desulfolutivibrio sulfodismutans]QLA12948.1 FtsX-like permease family protein [Desulfolutivibrio sulfodismutans DSM 3696]
MRGILIASHLALKDFFHEQLMSACAVLSLASILLPLLVLAGVRHGVVSALKERLLRDPTILSVLPAGSAGGYAAQWIKTLGGHPAAAFVIPRTRDIAATIQLESTQAGGTQRVTVDMEPTAVGDPLLDKFRAAIPGRDQVAISASVARKLSIGVGDRITGRLGRKLSSGKLETAALSFDVVAVLPLEAQDKDVVYMELALLEDAENYRDGIAVPERGFMGDPPSATPRVYGGFRLYARDLDGVAALRDHLEAMHVEVMTRAREIQAVKALDHSLTVVFSLIVASAAAGFMASTSSSVLASVRRKDKYLAMVRLLGFQSVAVRIFPLVQSLLTAVLGCLAAGAAYAIVGRIIDAFFSQSLYGEAVCSLPGEHLAAAFGAIVLLSLLSSVQASMRAARIDPAEVLREM